jgi:hypothetical protein
VVEAAWDLYRIKHGDLVLIDQKQANLARDGAYLLDLPGMAPRAIARSVGDKITLRGRNKIRPGPFTTNNLLSSFVNLLLLHPALILVYIIL